MPVLFVRPIWPEGYGERLLLAAIIRRSAYDIALYRGSQKLKARRIWREAYEWLMNDREDHFTSFVSICILLDQDSNEIRQKALMLRREDIKKYNAVD